MKSKETRLNVRVSLQEKKWFAAAAAAEGRNTASWVRWTLNRAANVAAEKEGERWHDLP